MVHTFFVSKVRPYQWRIQLQGEGAIQSNKSNIWYTQQW